MWQKYLLCQVDLLSELHSTECAQIFISLKAAEQASFQRSSLAISGSQEIFIFLFVSFFLAQKRMIKQLSRAP